MLELNFEIERSCTPPPLRSGTGIKLLHANWSKVERNVTRKKCVFPPFPCYQVVGEAFTMQLVQRVMKLEKEVFGTVGLQNYKPIPSDTKNGNS